MIAAIYARKSTDQNIADEEKSVTRQVERARAYAERHGWTVSDGHVYTDDAVSGAEFQKRPGYLRLMRSLLPRPPFQVLILAEPSRLGRDSFRTAQALLEITEAGVHVFAYLEDREITLDDEMDETQVFIQSSFSARERRKASQRTRDALRRKAERGHVAGGKVYGYRNIAVGDHREREVCAEEADVIRRIFRDIAAGQGFCKVAKQLNAERVPSPTGQGWAVSGVRALVFRPLYRGELVYGQTRWERRRGTTRDADSERE
jgi:DNA invertase Pin-like site-specific DNA recombinase